MFKRQEESEWTRFSKALGGRDQAREREDTARHEEWPEREPDVTSAPSGSTSGTSQSLLQRSVPNSAGMAVADTAPVTSEADTDAWTTETSSRVAEDFESLIGPSTRIDGSVRSDMSLRIHGSVQGEVESRGSVIVESDAKVDAKITARQIEIAGTVNGELSCTGRMEIQPSGRVTGEVSAGSLIMHEGAYFEGHLKMLNRSDQDSAMLEGAAVDGSTRR